MLTNMTENELMETNGGIPLFLGILAAGAIVVGTAVVVAGTVVIVGKVAQAFADWIGWF